MNFFKKILCSLSSVFILGVSVVPFVSFADYADYPVISEEQFSPITIPDTLTSYSGAISDFARRVHSQDNEYNFCLDDDYLFLENRTTFDGGQPYRCYVDTFGIDLHYGYTSYVDSDWLIIEFNDDDILFNGLLNYNCYASRSYFDGDAGNWTYVDSESFKFDADNNWGNWLFLSEIHINLETHATWGLTWNGENHEIYNFILNWWAQPEDYNTDLGSHVIMDNIVSNIDHLSSPHFDVDVSFTPNLVGEVDRSFLANGQTCYYESLTMHVQNNSSSAIQYSMAIYDATDTYLSTPIFRYLTSNYCYSSDLTNEVNYYNQVPRLFYKKSHWTYLSSGESTTQIIKYCQLPLEQKHNYRVVVKAVATEFDYPTNFVMPEYEDVYPDLYQLPEGEIVYSSVFSIKYLGDVPYDYTDTSNGITPFMSNDDFQRAYYEFSQYQDDNGNMQQGGYNLWDNPNSWIHKPTIDNNSRVPQSVSSDTTSLIRQSNNILSFFGNVLNFLPPEIKVILLSGVTVVVAVIILKFVRG